MSVTTEEKIEILSNGDDLLVKLYTGSSAALHSAWKKHEAQEQSTAQNGHVEPAEHPEDVLIEDERPTDWQEQDDEIEGIIGGIDIIAAYDRWCGKTREDVNGRTEGIMVSCPRPDHPDKNPSAWINTDKDTWFCGGCNEGGDKFDIAAWKLGYPVPGYKTGKTFPDLRREMAADLGYVIKKSRTGQTYIEYPEIEEETQEETPVHESLDAVRPEPAPEPELDPVRALPGPDLLDTSDPLDDKPEPDLREASVTRIFGEPEPLPPPPIDIEKFKRSPLYIDWEDMDLSGTFIGDYMSGTCVDHVPDEYNFWMALQSLGFATHMNVLMQDDMTLVKPGLFVVLYGGTGVGKSRSMSPMFSMLKEVMPWPDHPGGVHRVGTPGSGEALIDATTEKSEITSGATPEEVEPTSVWLSSDEFGTLTAIANRKGSTLKTALMELHDLVSGTAKDNVTIFSRTHGSVSATDKFFQVTSTVQPRAIGQYTSDMDVMTGFLNRWVFAMGNGRRIPSPRPPRKDVTSATARLRDIRDWADTPVLVEMTTAAFNVWADFYTTDIMPAVMRTMDLEGDTQDMADSFMARMELTLKKLCLFFAINEQSSVVEAHHVANAIRVAPYLKTSMMKLNKDFVWTFSTHIEEAILAYLDRRGKTQTRMRDITAALKNRFTRADINRSVQVLLDLGVIEETIKKGSRGPTGTTYKIAAGDD